MKNLKDTYRSTHRAIAARILSSPLASAVGYPNDPNRLKRLEEAAAGTSDVSTGWGYLSVELRRAGTSVSLDVKHDPVECYRPGLPTDDEGNEWQEYNLSCSINWPCHGPTDPGTSLARLELYRQAAMLAAEIQAEHPTMHRMVRTAAQVVELRAKEEAEKVQARVRTVVLAHRKGLRRGSDVLVPSAELDGIPVGAHAVQVNEPTGSILPDGSPEMKRYELSINIAGAPPEKVGLVTRTA